MCFSNLPVEFDEEGNPYLADEAEDVERAGKGGHGADCGCGTAGGDLADDPEEAYEAIVASLPEDARAHVERADGDRSRPRTDDLTRGSGANSAESD